MVNLYTQFLFDKEIESGIRIKEILALGLIYTLI